MLVDQLLESVEIAAHPHHEDPPHLHARTPDRPVHARKHVLLQQREKPLPEGLIGIPVLEPDEQGGNAVPGPESQLEILDADLAEIRLRIVCLSHACLREELWNSARIAPERP